MSTIESRMLHMTPKKSKSAFLTTRVSQAVRDQFLAKTVEYKMTQSDMLREFVEAFIEDRLSIKPPVTVKGNLYVS